jgi:predicted nucleic acid-binding protein
MNAVIDTNILVDFAQTMEKAAQELARYDRLLISRITWIEFLVGAKGPEELSLRQNLLNDFEIIELDSQVAEVTISIRKMRRLKLPDAIILATARVHGLLLVTRNHRNFPRREPDIRIPY